MALERTNFRQLYPLIVRNAGAEISHKGFWFADATSQEGEYEPTWNYLRRSKNQDPLWGLVCILIVGTAPLERSCQANGPTQLSKWLLVAERILQEQLPITVSAFHIGKTP